MRVRQGRGAVRRRWLAAVVAVAVAACSRAQPAAAPAPAPGPAAAPAAAAPPLAPGRAAGTYQLQATIQGRTIPAPRPAAPAGRRARTLRAAAAPAATLQLSATPVAALEPSAPSLTQLAGTIALPGYTMSARGRLAQAASWWPAGGDSVVVFFTQPQRSAALSLRGVLRGDTLSGDVWYTSTASGAEFQLGSFSAVRRRSAR